jgi:hypothetical protein
MEHFKEESDNGQEEKFGVLDYRIDNNHYVVDVRWKDGSKTTQHFPVVSFPVVDPINHQHLGNMEGERALGILQEHAHEYTHGEFSWRDFL